MQRPAWSQPRGLASSSIVSDASYPEEKLTMKGATGETAATTHSGPSTSTMRAAFSSATSPRAVALQNLWEEMFQRLFVYQQKHGDCLVPNRYSEDKRLGAWVSTQRRNYNRSEMCNDRIARLGAIGFAWKTTDPRSTPWMKRYVELLQFYKTYGHSVVPILFESNRPLANWVSSQRQEYRYFVESKPSRMTQERIRLLNEIDFVWDALRHRKPNVAQLEEQQGPQTANLFTDTAQESYVSDTTEQSYRRTAFSADNKPSASEGENAKRKMEEASTHTYKRQRCDQQRSVPETISLSSCDSSTQSSRVAPFTPFASAMYRQPLRFPPRAPLAPWAASLTLDQVAAAYAATFRSYRHGAP